MTETPVAGFMECDPPLDVADRSLPFHSPSLSEYDFEDLCAEVFESEFGIRFFRYGRRGDHQHGIDLISEEGDEGCRAVQCKRVQRFRPGDLRAELEKLRELPSTVSTLYFALACPASSALLQACAQEANLVRTQKGPVDCVQIWDSNYLSRVIRKYPNLVGSYFGLDWRNQLFPQLRSRDVEHNLVEIRKDLDAMKRQLGIGQLRQDVPPSARSAAAEVTLIRGIEGYFKRGNGIADLHGDLPSDRGFSFKYSVVVTGARQEPCPEGMAPAELMLSLVLTPEAAVDLEAVLVMDRTALASASTYHSHDVLLTHTSGPCPMISLPSRDLSFMLIRRADYRELLRMVTRYLDGFEDSALAARRSRTLGEIAEGVPRQRALLFGLKYED